MKKKTCFIPKEKVILLLQLFLNKCVLFPGNFCKQLQRGAMVSPVSPVIATIYMEYFEEVVLGPKCPKPNLWWRRFVDGVISIVKKKQLDTFFNYLNSVDANIKFTIQSPNVDGSIPFLDSKFLPNKDHSIQASVSGKPTTLVSI